MRMSSHKASKRAVAETGSQPVADDQPPLPFSRPSISADDIAAVQAVLYSGWLTTGRVCADLEAAFADRMGSQHAVALSSATAAMQAVLHALGIGPGDEVITPSMTWVSTVNLITLSGARPVFVDVDRGTLMTNEGLVRDAVSKRTKAIIPVHFAGAPLDLDPLRALAAGLGLPLIEDAAHAAGTHYRGAAVGGSGTAIFSLHPTKNMTAGEGGIICTDDAELAHRLRRLRFHGLGADAFDRQSQGRAPSAEVLEPGFKFNLPDMNAALALSQLRRLEQMNAQRRALAARYDTLLAHISAIVPLNVPSYPYKHSWHLYIVRVDVERVGLGRDEFMARLKRLGIGTGLHFRAVHSQRFYREHAPSPISLPATDWNSERICSLPLFPDMRLRDVDRVVDSIRHVLGELER